MDSMLNPLFVYQGQHEPLVIPAQAGIQLMDTGIRRYDELGI